MSSTPPTPPFPEFGPLPPKEGGGKAPPKPTINPGLAPVANLASIGLEILLYLGVFGGLGWLIDRWQGTRPTCQLVGLILGILVGGYHFIRSAKRATREDAERMAARPHRWKQVPDEAEKDETE